MPPAKPSPRVSLQAVPSRVAVTDVLRRWVALGTVAPGERLPTERELSELLGVGRLTVREAIRTLAEEGLLVTSRGRSGGTVVLDDASNGSAEKGHLSARLRRAVADNFDFRLGIEPVAARLAAERATKRERFEIIGLVGEDANSSRTFRAYDSRFHLAVAQAARNPLLLEAVERSLTAFSRWADTAWARLDWQTLSPEERDFPGRHRPIAEAIAHEDADQAQQVMHTHLEQGKLVFLAPVESRRSLDDRPGVAAIR